MTAAPSAARKTPEEKLANLHRQKDRLTARIQKEQARIRAIERKKDTRRKIIAGAIALEHMAHDQDFGATLKRLLDEHVTRTDDRKLFGMEK